MRQNPIVHQEVIQMKNKKLLTFVSAALIASTAIAPTIGSVSAANANTNFVRFATPTLDGELDSAYTKSYSFKLSDLASSGKIDMNTFQLDEAKFYKVAGDDFDTGYIEIYDADGKQITKDDFLSDDLYEGDYRNLPEGVKFRWTEAGLRSKWFTDTTFYFLYNGESIFVYADVVDDDPIALTDTERNEAYASGWSGRPVWGDYVLSTFAFNDMPKTSYEVNKDEGTVTAIEKDPQPVSTLGFVASYGGSIFYSDADNNCEAHFDTETAKVKYENTLSTLNDYCINWWEYCCFQDDVNSKAQTYRDMICDGSDTTPTLDENGNQYYCYYNAEGKRMLVTSPDKAPAEYQDKCELAFEKCSTAFHTFLGRHIFNTENLAARDEGRKANLNYVRAKDTDTGYAVEMQIPLTETAINYIAEGGSVSFYANICDGEKIPFGSSFASNGNATKWMLNGMSGTGDSVINLSFTKTDFVSSLKAGDINGDGEIDTKDIVRLMKSVSGQAVPAFNADVNNDDAVDTIDLVRLMKHIAGYEVELTAHDIA